MEETGTNIHTVLMRCNNFLRENPISGQIDAVCGKTTVWRAFQPTNSAMTEQEPGRRVWGYGLHW